MGLHCDIMQDSTQRHGPERTCPFVLELQAVLPSITNLVAYDLSKKLFPHQSSANGPLPCSFTAPNARDN